MAQTRHEQDLDRLQNQLGQADFRWLLQGLRQANPTFTRFQTWMDVIAFMREGDSRDRRKDDILRAIFETHGQDQDPRWRTILMVIFWPALRSILRQKARWDSDPEELWQNINWTFLRVICRLDARQRPYGLIQKVFNDRLLISWTRPSIAKTAGLSSMTERKSAALDQPIILSLNPAAQGLESVFSSEEGIQQTPNTAKLIDGDPNTQWLSINSTDGTTVTLQFNILQPNGALGVANVNAVIGPFEGCRSASPGKTAAYRYEIVSLVLHNSMEASAPRLGRT